MSHESLVNLLASGSAGLLARCICHPIDTVKAKLQSVDSFRGIYDVVKKTARTEGLIGFYQGIGAVIVGGVPGVCVYMTTYEESKAQLNGLPLLQRFPFLVYFGSGMIAEAAW